MIALPIFLSRPALLVGMPVSRANFCFIWVIPNALFNENDTPGIFMEMMNYLTPIDLSHKVKVAEQMRVIEFQYSLLELAHHPLLVMRLLPC